MAKKSNKTVKSQGMKQWQINELGKRLKGDHLLEKLKKEKTNDEHLLYESE